jgi:hypothetical protein
MALLKGVTKFIEARRASAYIRLALQKAYLHPSLRQQGSHGQSANATAHDNNFAVHLSANKVK